MLQRIGNYELLDVLGRGGQGVVYRARHADGHDAAVKVVAGAPSDALIARFQREQAMASEIDSPYAVKIYDYGEESGSYYIAMELVSGSLSGLLKDTPVLSTDRALHITDQIAAALEAAVAVHPGFVHRDIKPPNVLLADDGSVKVADFGTARSEEWRGLTQMGQVIGTPPYIAPEVTYERDPNKLDVRADLYSLGMTLYQMLSGQLPPADGEVTPQEFVKLQRERRLEITPIKELTPELSDGVVAFVERLLEWDREARFQTPTEVREAVAQLRAQRRRPGQPERLANYEIIGHIAAGGQATVYRARDTRDGREVAIKVMHPHLADDPSYIDRFLREARMAGQLSSPHVVRVLASGEEGGHYFMAMEFVPHNLRDLLRTEGRLDIDHALRIASQICEGLEEAFHHGIVHRDIKPPNIMLTADGSAKVADFGIARAVDLPTMTATGVVLGTALYMAPEQTTSGHVDIRADLYAVGVVLFEMLAGRTPFEADEALELLQKHQREAPPKLDRLRPGVPRALVQLVDKALAKRPERRFQSPAELRQSIEGIRTALARGEEPSPIQRATEVFRALPRPRSRVGLALSAVVSLALLTAGALG
ncbi:MAG: serine/threonine protein kinase, partial [Chloroflexi bacterium]|nr:serine/threonine protein kinase [Chloroflexota bacterium]